MSHKLVPLSLLNDNYIGFNIYRSDTLMERIFLSIVPGVALAAICWVLLYQLAPQFAGVALLPGLLAGGFGWLVAPSLIPLIFPLSTPFTIMYLVESAEKGKSLIPTRHTLGRGVDPVVYDLFKDQALAITKSKMEEKGIEGELQYRPTVNRATGLDQQLEGKIQAAKHRMPSPISKRVQVGLLVAMAFASMGIFFFVSFATVGP